MDVQELKWGQISGTFSHKLTTLCVHDLQAAWATTSVEKKKKYIKSTFTQYVPKSAPEEIANTTDPQFHSDSAVKCRKLSYHNIHNKGTELNTQTWLKPQKTLSCTWLIEIKEYTNLMNRDYNYTPEI